MFLGEILCFVAYWVYFRKNGDPLDPERQSPHVPVEDAQQYSRWIFALPATLDFTASCMQGVGLILTFASTFQMLRGSVVIFTRYGHKP